MKGGVGGALVVFAREPRIGEVKTRLAVGLGDAAAADVYTRLLSRTLRVVEASKISNTYLFAASANQVPYFQARLGASLWSVRSQCLGDIGERMIDAFETLLRNYSFVVLIGSDVADFQVTDINRAFTIMQETDNSAVLGPSADGGYWLIGLRWVHALLFTDMQWSTSTVSALTLERMTKLGFQVTTLSPRHDVDKIQDLKYIDELGEQCAGLRIPE